MNTKQRILALLETKRGAYLSGAEIAAALSVSRNAVWKAINSLRSEGYQISAVTNKGYCLDRGNDVLSVHGISQYLQEKSFADRITVFPSLVSTNQTAKECAVAGAPHGTVIIAETQTGGRGRYARQFFSPAGGLYLSAILHPERLRFPHITAITAFAAVAVCQAIEAVSDCKPEIKWVNDIFIGGKKVCGILTEAVTDIESGGIGWAAVGIGINVTTPADAFPAELREIAASVFSQDAPCDIRNRLAAEIIGRLVSEDISAEAALFAQYRKRLMRGWFTVIQGENAFSAEAEDIDEAGYLLVKLPDGSRRTLNSGEIRMIPLKDE